MNHGYGIEAPGAHDDTPHQEPARYLVVIDAAGSTVARLFLASRRAVAEFDAGAREVAVMTDGLVAAHGATGAEWDEALEGHSRAEREDAEVYTLDV